MYFLLAFMLISPSSSTFPFLRKANEIHVGDVLIVHTGFPLSFKVSDDLLNGSVQFDLFKNIVEVLTQAEVPE